MTREPEQPNAERYYWAGALLVLTGVAFTIYVNSLTGPFFFDDLDWIDRSTNIRTVWPLYHLLQFSEENSLVGRPVISLIMAVNYSICGRNVVGYHIFNITVHILAALTLMGIVRRTLQLKSLQARFGIDAPWLAFCSALLWMVHPVQTECACYITQRTESVMGLFYFLTMYCAIRAGESSRKGWWTTSAIVACAAGMGSKEVMVTAPIMVLLYDFVFRDKPFKSVVRHRRFLYIGLAACWGLLATLMFAFPHQNTIGASAEITSWQYLKAQSLVIVDYIKTIAWPDELVLDYGFSMQYSLSDVVLPGLIILALLLLTAWCLVRLPELGFLGAWFFITLAPTSSFVPILTEVGAERRLYLPLASVAVLFVITAYWLAGQLSTQATKRERRKVARRHRKIRAMTTGAIVVVFVAVLCWRTTVRSTQYGSGIAIMESAVAARPTNYRALRNLGIEYNKADLKEEAYAKFQEALELAPSSINENYHMGLINYDLRKYRQAEICLERVLEIDPQYPGAELYLKAARTAKAKFNPIPQQITELEIIAKRFLSAGENDRAAEYFRRAGQLSLSAEDLQLAIQFYRQAVTLQKDNFSAQYNLAVALSQANQTDLAFNHLQEAIRIEPNDDRAYFTLGHLHVIRKHFREAKAAYRRVLEINPSHQPARLALGELQTKYPD
ncbi:MAG: tetratricopeptide repeat protein [Planctomycetales bacterium]